MLLKPTHIQHVDWLQGNPSSYPSKEELIQQGWKEITIKTCPDREAHVAGGFRTKRKQYSLRHIGVTTIDHSQGKTIPTQLGIEITADNSPWMKSQIIVAFSRTRSASQMIVVGEKQFALEKMWNLIKTPTQWTQIMERTLHMLSINPDGDTPDRCIVNIGDLYPFRVTDYILPTDSTGFVYLLCSMKKSEYTYIGQCDILPRRLDEHNTGNGSLGTSDPSIHPLFVAGYITGLRHYDIPSRMSLEYRWKAMRPANSAVMNVLNAGQRLVEDVNMANRLNGGHEKLVFVSMISSSQ